MSSVYKSKIENNAVKMVHCAYNHS